MFADDRTGRRWGGFDKNTIVFFGVGAAVEFKF